LQLVKLPILDLALVWDWEDTPEKLPNFEEYEALMQSDNQAAGNSKIGLENYVGQAIRLWDFALALEDAEEYEKAAEKFQEALEDYETVLRRQYLRTPESKYRLTPLYLKGTNILRKRTYFLAHMVERRYLGQREEGMKPGPNSYLERMALTSIPKTRIARSRYYGQRREGASASWSSCFKRRQKLMQQQHKIMEERHFKRLREAATSL